MPFSALYLHIPFCRAKCAYCDFYSLPLAGRELFAEELPSLLIRELRLWAAERPAAGLSSVYFGGGTPSLLPPTAVARLLAAADECFGLADGAEITLECNPATVTAASLADLRAAGVNRLSVGAQSFDDGMLQRMGRLHRAADVAKTFPLAERAGFSRLSLDLIYGLPGQTPALWQRDLEQAAALAPEHISAYALHLSPQTPWGRQAVVGELLLPDDDAVADLYEQLMDWLPAQGYRQYEISNFSRPGAESRHNLAYWRRQDYLGLGPAAASCLAERRWTNEGDFSAWRQALLAGSRPPAAEEVLPPESIWAEACFLGLRLAEGIDLAALSARYDADLAAHYAPVLEKLLSEGLLRRCGTHVFPTRRGFLLHNVLSMAFL